MNRVASSVKAMAIQELEIAVAANSNASAHHESEIKRLSTQLSKLSEKCLDLEGWSKRQNLKIAGVKEGKEHSQLFGTCG